MTAAAPSPITRCVWKKQQGLRAQYSISEKQLRAAAYEKAYPVLPAETGNAMLTDLKDPSRQPGAAGFARTTAQARSVHWCTVTSSLTATS